MESQGDYSTLVDISALTVIIDNGDLSSLFSVLSVCRSYLLITAPFSMFVPLGICWLTIVWLQSRHFFISIEMRFPV